MPTFRQSLILLAVLAAGLVFTTVVPGTTNRTLTAARWPASDALYQVDGWDIGPAIVESSASDEQSLGIVQRTYRRSGEPPATLVIWTQPEPQAKTLLRKGADRDFLGEGYVSEAAAAGLVPYQPGRGALITRRGPDAWLVLYAYGERRGLFEIGPLAWGLAELDAFLDQPNDYFLARIMMPFQGTQRPPVAEATSLADVLFPRLAMWYQQQRDANR